MSALDMSSIKTAEEQVLRAFAQHQATTLSTSLLFDESAPFTHADIARAIAHLEQQERLLIRYTWDGTDWVTLTLLGLARRDGAQPPATPERRRQRGVISPEIVYEHPHRIRAAGHEYSTYILGIKRSDGTWAGWIEFSAPGGKRMRTGQETSQPNRDALVYWASGLEDIYLEGALHRARE
jgi:hypothetical protein